MSYYFTKVYRPAGMHPAVGDPTVHLDLRMWLLALNRMQRGGHAPLGSGELQRILTNAKGEPYSAGRYRQTRGILTKAGLLAPSASARCLLVPNAMAAMDAPSRKKREECATHKHNIPWDDRHDTWLFATQEEANAWEAECDSLSRRRRPLLGGLGLDLWQAQSSVNGLGPSAA
ncbi:hypothetical protein QZH56_22180 [Streptomyces olivoreticuli]|uniref:hypothetical protein n=1 Tax=Streptomyces olivoreticuli TaxID=68246 RepID=UPI00265A55D3|nr:hypothetical protein [Streptomyces olivoreticuli]WKK21555.1 hypothetical protein QZH56_22180 [Streptomyces olivoreticuli]